MAERNFENLNHTNCWDELKEQYPEAMTHFLGWLDGYKESIKWKTMFFKTKFHEIPFEMQLGILIQYLYEQRVIDTLMCALGTVDKKRAITPKEFKKKLTYLFHKLEQRYE